MLKPEFLHKIGWKITITLAEKSEPADKKVFFPYVFNPLKGLCHEEFAISDQFCTKIITKCLYSYTKSYEEDIK